MPNAKTHWIDLWIKSNWKFFSSRPSNTRTGESSLCLSNFFDILLFAIQIPTIYANLWKCGLIQGGGQRWDCSSSRLTEMPSFYPGDTKTCLKGLNWFELVCLLFANTRCCGNWHVNDFDSLPIFLQMRWKMMRMRITELELSSTLNGISTVHISCVPVRG